MASVITLRAGLSLAARDDARELRVRRDRPAHRHGIAGGADARPQDDAVVERIAARHAMTEHAVGVLGCLDPGAADDRQRGCRGRADREELPSGDPAHLAQSSAPA